VTVPEDPEIHIGISIDLGEVRLHEALHDIERDVQQVGWSLIGSEIDKECGGDGTFTYTIGMHKRGLPDLITYGLCRCSDEIICTLARRQLVAGAYEDEQITQIDGAIVRLTRWPYTAHLRLLNEFYRHYSDTPTLLLASVL
jgi:hypothetical protein